MTSATLARPVNSVAGALARLGKSLITEPISLRDFIRRAWPIIEPVRLFIENWHIDYIAEHLEAVDAGQIKRLVINIPPRMGKSSLVSVLWPAWSWTERPWTRWIFASYSASLSVKLSLDRRAILESDWFREQWGNLFSMSEDQNMKTEFTNTDRGSMVATSVGGTITGKGGDRIVVDDLMNPDEAESRAQRNAANDFFTKTLTTRLDEPKHGAIVVVMQRLHKDDLTGQVLRSGGWTHVKIPAKAETLETLFFPMSGKTVIRKDGEHLCEERSGEAEWKAQRLAMGSRAHDAQAQQKPSDEEGVIFKRDWWKYYRELPTVTGRSVWFWDTAAKAKEINDFWAGILVSECEGGYYVQRLVKARMDYPTGKRTVEAEFRARPAAILEVEDKSTGQAMIPELRRDTRLPVVAFEPHGDKVLRAGIVAPLVEAGKVFLPEAAPWVADFMESISAFPDAAHDDDVDALVGALMRLSGRSRSGTPGIHAI